MFELENHVYSVSEVTAAIKMLLESRFPQIFMEGEISNFRPSSAGHCYFTLKDPGAMIQAVLFRGDAARLAFRPKDGMKVKATGRLSVYAQRGNYQIICSSLEEQGKGSILEMLEERKRRLAAEGLFDSQYKKEIPPYPETVAVITSPTGAALRDILQVTRRRNSSLRIRILPCAVQGAEAANQIVRMIETANRQNLGDLIILSRGGGSLEDLLPFSEESVVRAVSSSYLPVITGIGHEIDFALADFAADLRAPTPSAAAELVCSSSIEISGAIENTRREMISALRSRMVLYREKLKAFSPEEITLHFRRFLEPRVLRIDDLKESMANDIYNIMERKKHELALLKKELEGNSPLSILERGYSIVTDKDGMTLKSSARISTGDTVGIRFAEGKASATIKDIE
ncbi:exodeoxyribonuclease VII large subunit [Spirochaeta isovalerica]|uniref:Exodeoxyribonuclease 7 large subunit n=1 Tax=Spirochaeta isovalerica TaxID=150 RepID=A0A841R7Z7_9SPIO|nr:exodeoxyribonuclease VII large subunit [Spirochaeta isovalerica]MBB6479160.1 exodeoxyribonuclease VII large subunit [Spirochaeta isovalerica]